MCRGAFPAAPQTPRLAVRAWEGWWRVRSASWARNSIPILESDPGEAEMSKLTARDSRPSRFAANVSRI